MYYVIDKNSGFVSHEDKTREGAEQYVRNASGLFGGSFIIAHGAKERDKVLKISGNR